MPRTRRRLDLNKCTAEQLATVGGGVTKPVARRIIAHRNRAGNFRRVDDLLNVRGVGERLLSTISDHFYVLPGSTNNSRRSSRSPSKMSSRRRRSRSGSPSRAINPPKYGSSGRSRSRSPLSRESAERRASSSSRPNYRRKDRLNSVLDGEAIRVDSAQNISVDLGKLAAKGCNLTLCGGGSAASPDGQPCQPLFTINVRELDNPEHKLSTPSPLRRRRRSSRPSRSRQRSPSPGRVTGNSSVIGAGVDVQEYLVVRDTTRTTQNIRESVSPIPGNRSQSSPTRFRKEVTRRDLEISIDESRSPKNRRRQGLTCIPTSAAGGGSPEKGRGQRSSPGKVDRRKSAASRDRPYCSRSDVENWLESTGEHFKVDQLESADPDVDFPIAASTPARGDRPRRSSPARYPPPPPLHPQFENRDERADDQGRFGRFTPTLEEERFISDGHGRRLKDASYVESRKRPRRRDLGSPLGERMGHDEDCVDLEHDHPTRGSPKPNGGVDEAREEGKMMSGSRSPDRPDGHRDIKEDESRQHQRHHRHHRRSSGERGPDRRHRRSKVNAPAAATSWCSIL